MTLAKGERSGKCYNCKYFKVLNTEAYKCQGTCSHPEHVEDGYLLDVRNFMDSCEHWEYKIEEAPP